MLTQLPTDTGPRPVRVVKVGSSVVDVDLKNRPSTFPPVQPEGDYAGRT